ncbi:MAG TPA: glycosyltransferase family A protein [Longimicrobiales bacterium]|nr:glycosyltransferase family A protein [Longimicrobiales bacterium]
MAFISVVVPMHGDEPYIEQCVDGLLSQRYQSAARELIFVDNGVSAQARALVDGRRDVVVIDEPTPGAYAARNAGLRASRGDIIAFTDADCAVSPDWLNVVSEALADRYTNVVVGSYSPARPTFAASALAAYENAKNGLIFNGADDDLYYGFTNNMAARAQLFDEVGEFMPRLRGSDAIFARTVVERYGHGTVRFVPRMSVRHLEIQNAADYYRKVFVHSRSIRSLDTVVKHRPLSRRERLEVFRRTVRDNGYSPGAAAGLMALLATGMLAWEAGGLVPWKEAGNGHANGNGAGPAAHRQASVGGAHEAEKWRRAM